MGRSDFRGAVQAGHASLAAIFLREKPDALQDCRCTARQTAAPCRATMEAFHDLRLDSQTFVRLPSYLENRLAYRQRPIRPPFVTAKTMIARGSRDRFNQRRHTAPAAPFLF